ncbi:hypothetical protein D9M68_378110 [compost metagenome]
MPSTAMRLGTKAPTPAAMNTVFARKVVPAEVVSKSRSSAWRARVETCSPKWNCGLNGATCCNSDCARSRPLVTGVPGMS